MSTFEELSLIVSIALLIVTILNIKKAVLNFGEINSYFLSIPNISPGQVTGSELTEGTPV